MLTGIATVIFILQKINGAVRNLEKTTREILAVLQAVHHSSEQKRKKFFSLF